MRSHRAMMLVTVAAAGGLGLFAPSPAVASCVGPSISLPIIARGMTTVSSEQVPVYWVAPGDTLTVDGEYFFVGCNDVIATHGCSAPPQPTPAPAARDVPLVLAQAGHQWTLGTADAEDADSSWAITWTAELPADLEAGPATLSAETAQLHLIIGLPAN